MWRVRRVGGRARHQVRRRAGRAGPAPRRARRARGPVAVLLAGEAVGHAVGAVGVAVLLGVRLRLRAAGAAVGAAEARWKRQGRRGTWLVWAGLGLRGAYINHQRPRT